MPIVRGSSMMSLGTWNRRSTKYRRYLNLCNVFLLITSTILIFSAIVLIKYHHITKLDFWSIWFYINPVFMVSLGLYTFCVSVFGFVVSSHENRCFILLLAILMGVAVLGQIFSIFSAMELRNVISNEVINPLDVVNEMKHYGEEGYEHITSKWDEMQQELRCCGGEQYEQGYLDWRNAENPRFRVSVPDSCCHEVEENCGLNKGLAKPGEVHLDIYKDGCVAILKKKATDEVEPMMIVYSCVGVVLAIVEMITVALACAFVAQISRRKKREEMFTRAGNAGAGGGEEYMPSLTKETNF